MAINFSIKTQAAAYADGYQDALQDIAKALEDGGDAGVSEWLLNNWLLGNVTKP